MKTRILLSKQQTTTQQQQQQQQQKPQHLNNIARNIQNINRFVDSASGHRHWTPHIPIIESENTLSRIADNTKCNSTKCRHMRLLMPVMCSRFIYPMCFRPMPKVAEPTEWLNVFFFFFFVCWNLLSVYSSLIHSSLKSLCRSAVNYQSMIQ